MEYVIRDKVWHSAIRTQSGLMQLGTICFFDLFPLLHLLLCLDHFPKRPHMGNHLCGLHLSGAAKKIPPHRYLCGIGLCNSFALSLWQDWRVILGFCGDSHQSSPWIGVRCSPGWHRSYTTSTCMRFFLAAFRRAKSFEDKFSTCETSEHQQSKRYNHTFNKYWAIHAEER